jgi:SAM-dependent methyltransferase
MSDAFGCAAAALSKPNGLRRTNCITWSPSGWLKMASAPRGTGIVTLGCSAPFQALRIGIPNAASIPYKIAQISACPSTTWNDYVTPTGKVCWKPLTFAGQGKNSELIVDDDSAPVEITALPQEGSDVSEGTFAPRWTWTDWTPIRSVSADLGTGLHVIMIRWLNTIDAQMFTYANGLFAPGWTGCPNVNRGFDYAIGGYNNGSDHVSHPAPHDLNWATCQRNSLLNGTPLAIVQFRTESNGIVGLVTGDSHQCGTGTNSSFNNLLAQATTSLGRKYRGRVPFGYINCAVGGMASQQMFARLDEMLPIVRPSFAVLPGWTYNEVYDGVHASQVANGVFLYRLSQALETCRKCGVLPIVLSPFPRDRNSMTPDIAEAWRQLRHTILDLQPKGTMVIDCAAVLGQLKGGQLDGTYLAGMSDDQIHPNDAAHARVASELVKLIEGAARLGDASQEKAGMTISYNRSESLNHTNKKDKQTPRTLLFCTSYAESIPTWNERWGRWLKAVTGSGVIVDKILMVDDGSPVLPSWSGVNIVPPDSSRQSDAFVEIHHFPDRRGQRVNGEPFPGWYRSFAYGVRYGIKNNFDRIIHIEADAFLISDRAVEYFNSCVQGWVGLWCQRHSWPESTLQIINKDQFDASEAFFSLPYSAHLGPPYRSPEQLIPFTFVNKSLVGDRYGEDGNSVPIEADYVSQVKWNMGPDYYWWLTDAGERKPAANQRLSRSPYATNDLKETSKMPRIVALSMVKNEQDIIEPFVRHTNMFVDFHVILDNGSVDETRAILTKLMRELDGVIVTNSSEFAYRQSERMSKLFRFCQAAFFADYVIFLDADEFISCESRSAFEDFISRIPSGSYGCIPWRTFVLTPYTTEIEQHDPPRSMPWRRAEEHERNNVVLRLDGKYVHDLVIAQGAHSVSTTTGRSISPVRLDGLYLNHFPIRSREQFVAKSIVGWMAYLAKDPSAAQKGEGYHWRENYNLATRGPALSYETLCDLSMRYDHPPREYIWVKDVVRDLPPDRYERRYSTGEFGDPLSLVSRSWQVSLEPPRPIISFERNLSRTDASSEQTKAETAFDAQWHWENPFADVAPFRYLAEKYQPISVLDVGCGIGAYLKLLQKLGARTIFGIDGIPKTATMLDDCEYSEVDLTRPLVLSQKFDVVLCLEVAEHLPFDAADNILEILSVNAQGLIVFSAAEPGQPGHGHINSRPIEYWLDCWKQRGWTPVLHETLALRAMSTLSWFKRNIVVLERGSGLKGEIAIRELTRIGLRRFAWHHTNPGVRQEILSEDMPPPPFGYNSEI